MRLATALTTIAILSVSTFAAPYSKRDTNSNAIAKLEAFASSAATGLSQIVAQIQQVPVVGGQANTLVQSLVSELQAGIASLESASSEPAASTDASAMASQLKAELSSAGADMQATRTELQSAAAASSPANPINVNDITQLLGALIPPVSKLFNEVTDLVQSLDLPPL